MMAKDRIEFKTSWRGAPKPIVQHRSRDPLWLKRYGRLNCWFSSRDSYVVTAKAHDVRRVSIDTHVTWQDLARYEAMLGEMESK